MALLVAFLLVLLGSWLDEASCRSRFQDCQGEASNLTVLEVLPGSGWDNLRNVELGLVLRRNYAQCRITEDRAYLIPDQVHTVPRRQNWLEIYSELIEDWKSYKDIFAISVNLEASFLSMLNGKFSTSSQRIKGHYVYDETVTARVQTSYHAYGLMAQPPWTLAEGFRQQLLAISDLLESNRTQQARYQTELLVLAYGTHVITQVEAGASLVQEDQVKRAYMESNKTETISITASASSIFYSRLQLGGNITGLIQNQQESEYLKNTVSSEIHSHGGRPFYPGITLKKWQESIPSRLAAIGRSGLPLPFFITPEALPELPVPSVRRLALEVQNAVRQYYAVNTYPGCLNPKASNFNFQANVDDGSCQETHTNFTFGGVFQECQPVSGKDAEAHCEQYRTRNPLTGSTSCPSNYTAILLNSEERSKDVPKMECRKQCTACLGLFKCCKNLCGTYYYPNVVRLSAYWCTPNTPVLPNSGFLFGGLYTREQGNPLTKAQSCPLHFYPLLLLEDLRVCVSNNFEMGAKAAIPFGGFFSCQVGNPLAGLLQGQSPGILKELFYQSSTTDYPMKCPPGYSQHQAYLSEGCQILYCLEAGKLFAQQLATIHLPPFLRPPMLNESNLSTATLVDSEDGSRVWVRSKFNAGHWHLVNASQTIYDLNDQEPSGPGRGTIIGICVSVLFGFISVVVLLVCVITDKFYKHKNYLGVPVSDLGSDLESNVEETQTPA